MQFPQLDSALMLERLAPPVGKVRMVLDTDTFNEIDDQFAVVQSLLSPDKLAVEAIYAAPFDNGRSSGPGDGMEKSWVSLVDAAQAVPSSSDAECSSEASPAPAAEAW